MSEQSMRRLRVWRWLVAIALLALVCAILLWVVVSSATFHRYVQARVVNAIETATGGKVDAGSFTWNLRKLEFTMRNLTIHGLEGANEVPYAHVDRLYVDAKVISVLGGRVGLQTLYLEHPVIHIVVYADGRTNQPAPKRLMKSTPPVEELFRLQVDRAEVRDGVVLINDRPLPLDFSAEDVRASLDHAADHYVGQAALGRIETRYGTWRPFASSASAAVNLYSDHVQITSFEWTAGASSLHASGVLKDFSRPEVEVNYSGRLDVAQFAPLMRIPEARTGMVEVSGAAHYAGADYIATGKLQVSDLTWTQPELRLAGISGGADYRLDKTNVVLPHIFASALGGTLTGDANIRDWSDTSKQQGTLRMAVRGVALRNIAAALATASLPLDRMRPAGSASGMVEANWKGSPAGAIAAMQLTFTPPSRIAPGDFPVEGRVSGTFSPATQVAQIQSADIHARTLHLTGAGAIGWRGAHLNFTATATELHDADPLLTLLHIHLPLPPETTAGRASMVGTLGGNMRAPLVTGHIDGSQVAATLPATPSPRRVAFDRLTMDLRYSPSSILLTRGLLQRGSEQARFSFSSSLVNGSMVAASAIAAGLSTNSFSLADLIGLAGYRYPLTGSLNASLQIGGTEASPTGSGTVRIDNGSAWGEPIRSASANLVFANHEAQATNIVVSHNGARVTGDGAYNLSNTAFRFRLQGNNFELANLRRLQSAHVRTSGQLTFTAEGSGTTDKPVINADLRVNNWVVNGESVGALALKAATVGEVMRLTGTTGFRTAEMTLDGTVRMREDYPINLTLRFAHLDFDPLLSALTRAHLTGHSSLDGTLTLSGPLKSPRLLTVTGNIPTFSANVENVHVQNDGPVRFTIANEVLKVEQFQLTGTDTNLTASGTAALRRGGPLEFQANGNVNLQLLQSFNSDIHSAGQAAFQLQIRGTTERPVVLGRVNISNGDIALINLPNGLSSINGTLLFNQDRIQVEKLTALTGGGTVNIGGFVSYGQMLGFNLGMKGSGVRVRYPAGVSTTVNPDLQLTGTQNNMLLTGTLTVTRFSTGPDFDLANMLGRVRLTQSVPNPKSPLNSVHFDVHVVSTPELQVQMSAAKMSGNLDVRLRGTADHPVLLGRVDITEGQITFSGTNFTIERGDITFTNPVRIEPVLDVEVTTRVRDYEIALGFHGPMDHLSTTYRSDPPLPTTDIIALLAFGTTRSESAMYTEANPTFTETASNAILGQALAQSGSNRVQKLFGASRIKISPEVEGTTTDTNPNAQVTIEQQVSKNITVTYITDLSRSQQQVIQMEYAINRNFSIIALRDQNGVLSFDFRYRQRKR